MVVVFVCLSIYLSLYLSVCLPVYLSVSLKTQQFCETSSIFELDNPKRRNSARLPQFKLDNIKNEAILRDVLQKWKVECRADGLVPMRFVIIPVHVSKVLRLPRKSEASSYEVLHLSRKMISAKPKDLMLQNATSLRKSAPGPPNSSDEHVSCTAPATENASCQTLQMSHTCHRFWNARKLSRFAHFWQGAQSLAPATQNDIWTSKSGPKM